ncbi:hypothetical protein NDU88_005624 [Pleurodeles waltl]|uniref:Uncharacterized protein n=1 Tax=Pleurodeles waltl TaxID=8319 RepID=A0AAV7MAI9_PLEWA|nr:hypothetical protein NDU88_005624 [Pleurodeles waltl]
MACEKGPFQVDGGIATFFPDFTLAVQNRRATILEVKRALREEGLRYSLLFPSKLKVILDGNTHFFQEPDEVWALLEAYHKGSADITQMDHKQPRRRGEKRHIRVASKDLQVTKPTNQQACQGKKAALQAAASLTETKSSEDGLRSEPESQNGEDSTDTESNISGAEGLPHVTLQSLEDII